MAEGFTGRDSNPLSLEPIECVVCKEVLADPRVLPCGHSFCGPPRDCLKAVQKGGFTRCAVCKSDFRQSVESLKPLFGIRDYLKDSALQRERQKSMLDLSEVVTCEDHFGKVVHFWCNECQRKVCMVCFETNHDQHSMTPYRKYLQLQLKKYLRIENEFSKEVLNLSDDVIQRCDDRILTLELDKLRYRRFKLTVLHKGNEYRKYLVEECSKFSEFAKDINADVNLKHVEVFLKQQSEGKNLKVAANRALESLKEDKKVEFVTTFHGYSVGGKFRSWEGGADFIQGCNQFKIGVVEPQYATLPVDSSKTPLVASISWIHVGEREFAPKLSCFSFDGHIVVCRPDKAESGKIYFNGRNNTISSPYIVVVEKELPLIFCEPLSFRKALTTAKQRLSISLAPKDLIRHTFVLRCVIKFRLSEKQAGNGQCRPTVIV